MIVDTYHPTSYCQTITTLKDYFIPPYIEAALRQAGLYQVTQAPFDLDSSLAIEHLETTPEGLALMGSLLRQRQIALSAWGRPEERLLGLGCLAEDLGRPESGFRREALGVLPRFSGFSVEMIQLLLDSFSQMFRSAAAGFASAAPSAAEACQRFIQTPGGYYRFYPRLTGILRRALGVDGKDQLSSGSRSARVPRLVTSVAAGNVPGISLLQAFFPLAVGAACLAKNARAEPYFGPRFLAELAALEQIQGLFPCSDLVALVTFPGTDRALLEAIVHQGDHLVVTGGHDSRREIQGIANRLRFQGRRDLRRRISGHWHKVSFDLVAGEFLEPAWIEQVAYNVAFDNSMFNTQGCLSCQQVFVEGSESRVQEFARQYSIQMRAILSALPKGCDPGAGLRQMYTHYETMPGVRILTGLKDLAAYPYFVAYERQPRHFAVHNALNRSILIRRLENLEADLPALLKEVPGDLLQSCGAAIPESRLLDIAEILGLAGVNRIAPAGDIWNMVPGLESWDGYLPPDDLLHEPGGSWTTIKFHQPDQAIRETYQRNVKLLHGLRSH